MLAPYEFNVHSSSTFAQADPTSASPALSAKIGWILAILFVVKFARFGIQRISQFLQHVVSSMGAPCPITELMLCRRKHSYCRTMPSQCCPKRRARWEKKWNEKHYKKKICIFRQLFCLPPPLPLRTERTTTVPQDSATTQEDASSSQGQDEATSSSSSLQDEAVTSHQAVPLVRSPPQVHLIDLVRMQQWDALLRRDPWKKRQVKYRDTDGLYPLHWAAAGGTPLAVVERLLQYSVPIAQAVDTEGSLPLHFAAHYSASRDVIAAIWKAYPDAILHRDRYGRPPLYHAVDKCLSLSTFQILMRKGENERLAYELITTPCYTQAGSTAREQATRTPLFMIWASVLNDGRGRGKTWGKAVWMLQQSHEFHYQHANATLLSMCLQMDVYLPEPVIPMVAAQTIVERSDLTVAVSTPSYSILRILHLVKYLLTLAEETEGLALAAAQAGQPWQVLELFSHRDRHALAIAFAMSTPIQYEAADDTPTAFQHDPLGLLWRVTNDKDRAYRRSHSRTVQPVSSPVDTMYRLLRENPGQLNTT